MTIDETLSAVMQCASAAMGAITFMIAFGACYYWLYYTVHRVNGTHEERRAYRAVAIIASCCAVIFIIVSILIGKTTTTKQTQKHTPIELTFKTYEQTCN